MTDTALAHAPADPTTSTPLTPSDVAGLRAVVAGPVLLPGQQGYPEETTAFNLALIPTPAVVVGVTSTADVVAAVNFARRHHRRVSVQATGHGLADTLDGTVMVSTRRLTGVQIDPRRRRPPSQRENPGDQSSTRPPFTDSPHWPGPRPMSAPSATPSAAAPDCSAAAGASPPTTRPP